MCDKLQEYKNALELQAIQEDKAQEQLQKDNQSLLEKIQVLIFSKLCKLTVINLIYISN